MPGDMDKDERIKQAGVAAAKRKVSTVFRKLNVWQERDDLKGMPRIGRFADMSVQLWGEDQKRPLPPKLEDIRRFMKEAAVPYDQIVSGEIA